MVTLPLLSNGQLSNGFTSANQGGPRKSPTSIRDVIDSLRTSTQPHVAGSAGNAVGSRAGSASGSRGRGASSTGYVAGSASNPVGAKAQTMPYTPEQSTDGETDGGEDRLSQMRSAADAKGDVGEGAGEAGQGASEANRVSTTSDPFMAMFERYSDENLGGMGLGEFLQTDGSQEDRDMWREFTSDPLISRFYSDAIDEAGGFDSWYDQMTGVTLDDIMADPSLQYAHFGGSDDTVHAIHDYAAASGWVPDVSGDGVDSANLRNLFYNDPSLAATVMDYMFAMNALNNQENVTDTFSLDEMSNLLALDQMEYGYGDNYTYSGHSVPDDGEQFLSVDPEFWLESAEKGWSSVPGYGLSNRGATGLMRERYGAGFARRPGVDDAYAAYRQQQGGDQQ